MAGAAAGIGLNAQNGTATEIVSNGRIRQSIMGWCFRDSMDAVTLAAHCKEIGLVAMEGISTEHYPAIMELGLEVSLVSGNHGFAKGPCNPEYHDMVIKGLIEGIDLAKEVGCQNVITFTGMRFDGMDDDKAAQSFRDKLIATGRMDPLPSGGSPSATRSARSASRPRCFRSPSVV